MLRSDELQTKLDELLDTVVAKLHCVVRGTTARYCPKFEPVTLMLLRCCEVTEDGEGVLKLYADESIPRLSITDDVSGIFNWTKIVFGHF